MNISGDYLGMTLSIDSNDHENQGFYHYCAQGELRLQSCSSCQLLRYPPTTACPWCGHEKSEWLPVEPTGTIYSYAEIHHAIQPEFKPYLPYLILIVELDVQKDKPQTGDALRVTGNLALPNGDLAPSDIVAKAGIGSRVRMIFKPVAEGLAVPLWVLDEAAEQPLEVWRYPHE